MDDDGDAVPAHVREIFAAAGCRGTLHVHEVGGDGEVAVDADRPVAPASVFKVQVALEAEIRCADGRLDPRERVVLRAGDRTPGPTGFSLFADDAAVSLRDAVTAMLTVSDNAATDALLDRFGADAVNTTAVRLGLTATRLASDVRGLIDALARDGGFADWAELTAWSAAGPPAEEDARVSEAIADGAALDPARGATRTTARETTALLRLVWTDAAGPAAACARVRSAMARQVTRHRLASGFRPPVRVAAKSGSLAGVVRNEAGVVSFPDGRRYAAAVFTRSRPGADDAAISTAIGRAAAVAVGALR